MGRDELVPFSFASFSVFRGSSSLPLKLVKIYATSQPLNQPLVGGLETAAPWTVGLYNDKPSSSVRVSVFVSRPLACFAVRLL